MREWLAKNFVDIASVLAIAGIAIGFWLAWEPLGLIVPCLIVFVLAVASRLMPQDRDKPSDNKREDSPDA